MLKDFLTEEDFTQEEMEDFEDTRIIYSKDFPKIDVKIVGYEVFDFDNELKLSKIITGKVLKIKQLTTKYYWISTRGASYILKIM